MPDSNIGQAYPSAICLDGSERELAETIVSVHDRIIQTRGYNPLTTQTEYEEMIGRAASVVSSSFGTVFDIAPCERYGDLFDQVADFAMHLSKGHIFPDGNKRTTVITSLALLVLSGCVLNIEDLDKPDANELYRWIQGVVQGEDPGKLAQRLRAKSIVIRQND